MQNHYLPTIILCKNMSDMEQTCRCTPLKHGQSKRFQISFTEILSPVIRTQL